METKLADVIHYYLGCQVQTNYKTASTEGRPMKRNVGKFIDIDLLVPDSISVQFDWHKKTMDSTTLNIKDIKPILRTISDMTEMEIIKLLAIVYKNIFTYEPDIHNVSIHTSGDPDEIGLKCTDRLNDSNIGLTIEKSSGIEFSHDSQKLMVNQFDCVSWLLRNHFDLFALIESGQAIDKTNVKSEILLNK